MPSLTSKTGLLAAANFSLFVAVAWALPAIPHSSMGLVQPAASATKAADPSAAVQLTAAPRSGPAPLAVTFTVRVGRLPIGMPYTINFGDGSSGTLRPNAMPAYLCGPLAPHCVNPTPTFSTFHTYTSPGAYTATLINSSGATLATETIKVTAAKP